MSNSSRIVVFDIDGTLANCTHRLHFLEPEPSNGLKKDWKSFFKESINDLPYSHVLYQVERYNKENYVVVLCTGRPANQRDSTMEWLNKQGIKYEYLLMRLTTDRRPDYECKKDMLLEWLQRNNYSKGQIEVIFEDKLAVAKAWRDLEIPVFLCGDEWQK